MHTKLNGGLAEVDVLSLLWRTSVHTMGEAALGFNLSSLESDDPSLYVETLKNMLYVCLFVFCSEVKLTDFMIFMTSPTLQCIGPLLLALPTVAHVGSPRFRRFIVDLIPWRPLVDLKNLINYVEAIGKDVLVNTKSASQTETHENTLISIISMVSSYTRCASAYSNPR